MKASSDDRLLEPDDFARLAKLICLLVLASLVTTTINLVPGLALWQYLGACAAAFGTAWLANRLLISPNRVLRKRVDKAWRSDAMIEVGMLSYFASIIILLIGSAIVTGRAPAPALIPSCLTAGWACQGFYALWRRYRLLQTAEVGSMDESSSS